MRTATFRLLPQNEQLDLLYAEGVYIGKRKLFQYQCILYQYDAFYVELLYRKYRTIIHTINYYTSTNCLDPYLEQIDAEELIKC